MQVKQFRIKNQDILRWKYETGPSSYSRFSITRAFEWAQDSSDLIGRLTSTILKKQVKYFWTSK